MLARSSIARGLPQCCAKAAPSARRGMAAAANPFHYSVGNAGGVKVASRDDGGPTTSLAVVVRGGSRYESSPGLAHGLASFAFKNTTKRSALRLQRESELLGGSFGSTLSRENIVLRAKFLRDDLPYFVEALGEVMSKTKYIHYEFQEEVGPIMITELSKYSHNPADVALEHAHNVAFHSGLGGHRLAMSNKFSSSLIPSYAQQVYQKGNIAVVASGAAQAELEKWTGQFFTDLTEGSGLPSNVTKYYGGENRIYNDHGDAIVIAFPGSQGGPNFKAEFSVLAYLLGGESSTKWNHGTSALSQAVSQMAGVKAIAKHVAYSDAGLLSITVTGPQTALHQAGAEVVKAIKSLASVKPEDVKKAIAQAKFDVLAAAEDRSVGLELIGQSVIASGKAPQVEGVIKALEGVTVDTVKSAAKKLLDGKATYTAVGDLHYLPFAADIGLQV
ncbi:Metalloenzyme, LuxS/M16 peptidase-like protein [Tricharina praecox]|uniref:Metalloenzyme, LuxS/M16 peptidase-like protein n=1 Tax=Tricharina praecox TaxID=43433 RepID=UPI002220B215|nr:Metalloenzyme, LuxS/M16 peptidase-like protein [Tricharina praecox]KAI5852299.1 Metalloenzyme, LuxS/M16 peptidase-like protein [Tricharina praecox]